MNLQTKIVIGVLSLFVVLGVAFSWYTNRLLRLERERTTHYSELINKVRIEKDSLKHHADSIQVILRKYEHLIDSLDVLVVDKNKQVTALNKALEKALEEIQNAPYDDNYVYLQEKYPTEDTLVFPFSGQQVKDISKEILTSEYTAKALQTRIDITVMQAMQLTYKDEIIGTLKKDNVDLNKLAEELYDQIALLTKESYLKDEEIARLKKAVALWRIGALSGGAAVVLVLLLV